MSESIPNVTSEPALIKVTGNYIEIRATKTDLCHGEEVIFEAFLMNSANEELRRILVEWLSDRPSTATRNPSQGFTATITAGNVEGEAHVTAYNADYDLLAIVPVVVSRQIPKINITSYHNGAKAYASGANLVGTIEECGTRRVTKLTVSTASHIGSVDVDADGKFAIPVPLDWGINHLRFSTYDSGDHRIPNNMDGVEFTLRRVPHCLKEDNTLQFPINLYGTPVTYTSVRPLIASVDPVTGVVTGHANGWAPITTEWQGYTIVRWVGVSTETNYVFTRQNDPFYEPEHIPPSFPINGCTSVGSDLNDKYFTGLCSQYFEDPITHVSCYWLTSFVYDGLSFQNIMPPPWTPACTAVSPMAVNERGQVLASYHGLTSSSDPVFVFGSFIYDNGFIIDYPGIYLSDINNFGKVVGNDYGGTQNFIIDIGSNGGFTYLDYASPFRINDAGQVLGITGNFVWIYKNGAYETVIQGGPGYYPLDASLHESGKVHVTYENGNSVLLTRCAP